MHFVVSIALRCFVVQNVAVLQYSQKIFKLQTSFAAICLSLLAAMLTWFLWQLRKTQNCVWWAPSLEHKTWSAPYNSSTWAVKCSSLAEDYCGTERDPRQWP